MLKHKFDIRLVKLIPNTTENMSKHDFTLNKTNLLAHDHLTTHTVKATIILLIPLNSSHFLIVFLLSVTLRNIKIKGKPGKV